METLRFWLKGIRFYIAVGAILVTGLVIWWAQATYGNGPLRAIRIEEIFAWLATGLLALAVSIGPAYKLFKRLPGAKLMFDARRLIGISAAWFAGLHVTIAYLALFKLANPFSLPHNYQLAFLLGAGAMAILLAMAFTSFDKAFKAMGIWWFRLHRLVYAAIALALFHMFMIGVHTLVLPVLGLLTATVSLLLLGYGLIALRSRHASVWQVIGISSMAVVLACALGYGFHQHSNMVRRDTPVTTAATL